MQKKSLENPGACWLLHSKKFKENAAICTMLSANKGKISILVNGVTSKKKRQIISPFHTIWLEYQNNSGLKKAANIENGEIHYGLLGNKSICGLYLNELLIKTLPEDETNNIIFQAYQQCLQQISQYTDPTYALREFEDTLLKELGYGLPFTQIIKSDYDNFLYCCDNGFIGICHAKENSFSKQILIQIMEKQWQDIVVNKQAKKLFRLAFQPLLNYQPLKCRDLFADMVIV